MVCTHIRLIPKCGCLYSCARNIVHSWAIYSVADVDLCIH